MPTHSGLRLLLVTALIACVGTLGVLDAQSPQRPGVAIRDVAAVDVSAGTLLQPRTVILDQGRIRSIAAEDAMPAGAESIDGTGKFLMPGLWDMHGDPSSTSAAAWPPASAVRRAPPGTSPR
jgi:hypothetical protein